MSSTIRSKVEGILQTVGNDGDNTMSTWPLGSSENFFLHTHQTKKLSKHDILKLSMKYITFLSTVLKEMDSNEPNICSDCGVLGNEDSSKCSASPSGSTSSSDCGVLSTKLDLEHVSVESLTSNIQLEEANK